MWTVTLDKHGADRLFSFFSQCNERTRLIATRNLPCAEWPDIFAGDGRLAGALIDRTTHRVHVIEIRGEGYWLHVSLGARKAGGFLNTPNM
ncbi:MAG: ATP-binding protein [Pirellulales bacterium]|nr:ATP-binding protein [Pirellulales bacterium]